MTKVGRASQPRFQHMYTLRYDTRSAMQRQAKIMKFRRDSALRAVVLEGCLFFPSRCIRQLLPALEDLDHAVSANVIQILVLLYNPVQVVSACRDPDHPTDVLGCPRV